MAPGALTSKAGQLQYGKINKTKGPTERHQLSKVTGPQSVTVTIEELVPSRRQHNILLKMKFGKTQRLIYGLTRSIGFQGHLRDRFVLNDIWIGFRNLTWMMCLPK